MHGTADPHHAQRQQQARDIAYATPLADFDPGNPELFRDNTFWPYFERLRREEPVHHCRDSMFGPYWSVTKYNDIVQMETAPAIYSSAAAFGGITIRDVPVQYRRPMFIATDPPHHSAQRKTVAPMFTPHHMDELSLQIRERTADVLDALPRNETFDWVDRVSVELTTQMLATLFDFPWEERRKLTHWSDVATMIPPTPEVELEQQKELRECGDYFGRLFQQRMTAPPKNDLLSMMAHSDAMHDLDPEALLGNIILLIVGGNDTTRNSMSGSIYALNEFPGEYDRLRANPALIDSMVPEIIRWQTPLAHMRRTALQDTELGGKQIRKGDKVVMWYVSGNRDDEVIEKADAFIIDREKPNRHLSFGFGIHRCIGLRLAELQLKIMWEEIMKRFGRIELVAEPRRVYSSFVKGYETLPVRITG
jgi:cytochrome P450